MFQDEKRVKTRVEVLEIVKEFLLKGAVQIKVDQMVNKRWQVIGKDFK